MKIAVATDDFSTVTGHIGRCNGFLIFDIENSNVISKEGIENAFTHHKRCEHHHGHHEHSHGHSHMHLMETLKGRSYLICTSAGWWIAEV